MKPLKSSSQQKWSIRKGVIKNFTKFTGKHLCESLFFNKVAGLRPVTLLKKRLWHRFFPMDFVKFLKIPFLQNTSGRLLLHFTFDRTLIKKLMVWSWAPRQLYISECLFSLPHKKLARKFFTRIYTILP